MNDWMGMCERCARALPELNRTNQSRNVAAMYVGGQIGPYRVIQLCKPRSSYVECACLAEDPKGRAVVVEKVRGVRIADYDELRNLRHRNLVKYLPIPSVPMDDDQGRAQEHVARKVGHGDLLAQVLAQGESFIDELEIAASMAKAVQYLHNHFPKVASGPLSPGDIFLGVGGRVQLTGYGMSADLEHVGFRAAPEVLSGGNWSQEADMWAFGILLAEILAHRTVEEIFPSPPGRLSEEALTSALTAAGLSDPLLPALLHRDPDARISCDAVVEELARRQQRQLSRAFSEYLLTRRSFTRATEFAPGLPTLQWAAHSADTALACGHDGLLKQGVLRFADATRDGLNCAIELHLGAETVARIIREARIALDGLVTHLAVREGDVEVLRAVLDNGAPIEHKHPGDESGERDPVGWVPPLFIAAFRGHDECVQELLARGARADVVDDGGYSPLLLACQTGRVDILRRLADAGAPCGDSAENGCTPMFMAAQFGHLDCVQELVARGVDVNWESSEGVTAIFLAVDHGHAECLRFLVAQGGDVNKRRDTGATPLYIAAEKGRPDCALVLLENGAHVDEPEEDGATPLFIACQNGHVDTAAVLIRHGADVNRAERAGSTPLLVACHTGEVECVRLLLEHGASVVHANRRGMQPIHAASGSAECLRVLFEARGGEIDVNRTAADGSTAVFLAAASNDCEALEELIRRGADVNIKERRGCSPLLIASMRGHTECVAALLQAHADVRASMDSGLAPLVAAAHEGFGDCVELLLAAGAPMDQADEEGTTAMVAAAYTNRPEILRILLEHGDDVNRDSRLPLLFFRGRGMNEVADILEQAGRRGL